MANHERNQQADRPRDVDYEWYDPETMSGAWGMGGLDEGTVRQIHASVAERQEKPVFDRKEDVRTKSPLVELIESTPKPDPTHFVAEFMSKTKFGERGAVYRLVDKIRYWRHRAGRAESYGDRLGRLKETTGRPEAASWGEAEIGGRKVILFATHWEFMRGSVSEGVVTKYVEAADEAANKGRDLVALWATGGMRVDEGTVGIPGMEKMQLALHDYKEKTKGKKCSYISILCEAFGGVSATVARGNITLGVSHTSFGFTGPDARRAFQGGEVDEEVQMIESQLINNRKIDYLVESPQETYDYIARYLKLAKNRKRNNDKTVSRLKPITQNIVKNRVKDTAGFYSIFNKTEESENPKAVAVSSKPAIEMGAVERYGALLRDPNEPDFQDFLKYGVEDVVPFYVGWKFDKEPKYPDFEIMHYPAIIGALGRIGDETYLFVGNQPSYYWQKEEIDERNIKKRTSTPGPQDCDNLIHLLRDVGENLDVTVVRYAETLGALPTDDAERTNISDKLSESADAARYYKGRSICIKQVDASGGGRPTGAWADARAARRFSHTYIAEPTSNLVISGQTITREQLEQQLANMQDATAATQVEFGIVVDIIDEPDEGAANNPEAAIFEQIKYIVQASARLNKYKVNDLMKERLKSLRNLKILLEAHSDGQRVKEQI